jgi:protoporphyrinogen oxidase
LLEHYVPITPTWGRLTPQGTVTAYPVSIKDDLLAAGPSELFKILASLAYARIFRRKMRNAREFAQYYIGDRLLRRSGLDSYMTRFYGISCDQIGLELAKKRMLWISENSSVRSLLFRLIRTKSSSPTNRQLARPREGFSQLYMAAASQLSRRGASIITHANMLRLHKSSDGFRLVLEDRAILAKRVVSTIPIKRIETLCNLPVSEELDTVTLLTLYFSFAGKRGFNKSILYNFSHHGSWKRLTMYSDFYGLNNGREYFAAEVIYNLQRTSGSGGRQGGPSAKGDWN